jgi:cysteine synthase
MSLSMVTPREIGRKVEEAAKFVGAERISRHKSENVQLDRLTGKAIKKAEEFDVARYRFRNKQNYKEFYDKLPPEIRDKIKAAEPDKVFAQSDGTITTSFKLLRS